MGADSVLILNLNRDAVDATARASTRLTQAKSPYFFSIDYDPATMNMSAITVPTSETCSVAFWMTDLVKRHRPVMLAGPSGTGKTQQVNGILKAMDPAAFLSATINFNFYTTSAVLGNTMCLPLEKKTGTNFGADSVSFPRHDPKLNFGKMASPRRRATSTPSTGPRERLRVS